MPDDLFPPATLARLRARVGITADQHDAALEWLSLLEKDGLQEGAPGHPIFASCMLGRLLGYRAGDIQHDPGSAEFELHGPGRRPVGCVVTTGTPASGLCTRRPRGKGDRPARISRARDRAGAAGPEYGMRTDYRRFVLFAGKDGCLGSYEFDFESARGDPQRLREFVGVFGKAGVGSGFAEGSHAGPADEDGELADEFYGLYRETRLMLAREFESSGVKRGDAAAAAQALLLRLVFAFFALDSGPARGADVFADGVIGALNGRLGDRSMRVWSYLAGELLPGLDDKGSRPPRIPWLGGGPFGGPLPRGAAIMDLRPPGFFGDLGPKKRRRSWLFKERVRDAAGRHGKLNPIIGNLLAMSSYDFRSQIRVTMLGHILERSLSEADGAPGPGAPQRRKREGVFYTPARVARLVCRGTIVPWLSRSGRATDPASLVAEYMDDTAALEERLRGIRILDPACGSGAFLIEAAGTLLDIYGEIRARRGAGGGPGGAPGPGIAEASPPEIVRNSLYGIDVDPQSVELARLSVLLATASPLERLPDLPQRIVARDSVRDAPDGGWAAAFPLPPRGGRFDVIVGNPPYVRQEDIPDKDSLALPSGSGLALAPGFAIPRKSDLSSYFYYHSLACLAEGGRLGFIASDGWLHHDYGLPLQRAMLDNCRIDALLRPAFNVFDDADIKTVVSLLTRTRPAAGHRVPFAPIGSPRAFEDWTRRVVARRPQGTIRPGNWLAHFAGPVPCPGVPTLPMGRAGRLEGGIKTGRNKFFVLTADDVKKYSISPRFRRPVLSDGIADGCLGGQRAREHLLSVDLPKGQLARTDGGAAVLRYIEDAEAEPVEPKKGSSRTRRGIADLESLRGRDPWYSLGLRDDPPAIFLGRFIDRHLRAYKNNGRFYARDNFAGFTPDRPEHADALLACLASSWFALHLETSGHVAGGGALQVLIADLAVASVPDLGRMDGRDIARLGGAWEAYCGDLDRARLDREVLGILGFSGRQQERIAGQLAALVSHRTGGGGDD